ncbi:MAG: hypothetical protein KJ077_05975 [Anaerolineae bacterium]|nr:hypothetical protein [Anaerolineae bacterium]
MSRTSRLTSLALLLATLLAGLLLWPALALAQDPCPFGNDFSSDPGYETITDMYWNGDYFDDINVEGQPSYDDANERLEVYIPPGGQTNRGGASFIIPFVHTVEYGDAITVWAASAHPTASPYLIVKYSDDTYSATGPHVNGSWTLELSTATFSLDVGKTIVEIHLNGSHFGIFGGGNIYFDDLSANFCNDEEINSLCPLVANSHFANDSQWLLTNGASITTSILTLPVDGVAAQNLNLTSNRTYNAVISTTAVVSGTANLDVRLGTQSQSQEISAAGVYTLTFTTATLGGPIAYIIENTGPDAIDLDVTCVSLQSSGQTGQGECLAPTNGTFEDDSGWNWYRGAEWFYPGRYASLPLADYGMIGTSSTYTMPTLAVGEHLLLGFTARGLDDGGVVSGQITNGGSTVEFNYSTYEAEYSYEASLDTLAEETGVQLSFVNPGDVITDVLSTSDVVMDNVCVFIANRGPNLPTPTDPDGITPLDPRLQGFTSCGDLDGIWAGFGLNMAQYRADYAAGTSVWDPLGWVPWLISAIFVNLASWACFFFAAFLNLVDLVTYFLNSVMNIGNWLVRMWPLFVAWLSGWNDWLAGSLANIANAIGNTLAAWSNWIGDALWATSTTIGLTLAAASEWLGNSLSSLSDSIAAFLSDWSNWIAESLANLSDWIGATLATLWDWLASYFLSLNGLRVVINWLILAWNVFLAALGSVISGILETLISIWNDSLWPFLSEAWAWISSMPATIASLLVDFVGAAWELLKMMFLWLWENVVSVAHTPLTFYYAFDSGINADPYGLVSCVGANFWCTFLSGVWLINQLIAHSTLYPIIIVGIILSTLWILWDNFRELFFSPIEIR